MKLKNKKIIDTSYINSPYSESTEQDMIKEGIEKLLEKRLNEIKKAIDSEGDFVKLVEEETGLYNAVRKIAEKEGISTLKYDQRKEELKQYFCKQVIRRYG